MDRSRVANVMCFVFYQDWMVPPRFGGITYGFLIAIREKYRRDVGLLEHEKVHVRQFWRTLCLFPLIYLLSKKWRFRWEVEAYRKQMKHYADDRSARFAYFMATKYRLNITEQEAYAALIAV